VKKISSIFIVALVALVSADSWAREVPSCWGYLAPSNDGLYVIVLPDAAQMTVAELEEFLVSKYVFTITEIRYSRSLRGHVLSIKTEAAKIGPRLLRELAEIALAELPEDLLISCNPLVDPTL